MYSIVRGSRHGASRVTALVRRAASSAPTIKIPDDKLFLEYVSEKWSSFGDKPALVDYATSETITYKDLPYRIEAVAQ
eukprot:gene7241-13152_t